MLPSPVDVPVDVPAAAPSGVRPGEPVTLCTPRLRLRAVREADLPALLALGAGAAASSPPAGGRPVPVGMTLWAWVAAAGWHDEDGSVEWAIERRADAALVGTCALQDFEPDLFRAQVGCQLLRPVWGQGLAHEALAALIVHAGRACGLRCLRAEIEPGNARSQALFARLGFRPLGGRLHERMLDGQPPPAPGDAAAA